METIGNVCEIHREKKIEWEIKDFLMLKEKTDKAYKSPEFTFYGVSWQIWIYPYSETSRESGGYVGLRVASKSVSKPIIMEVSLSLKTVEGKSDLGLTYTRDFKKEKLTWGWDKFISRSDLIKRKSELLHSGALIVICTLKNVETNVVTADNIFVNASAQTVEGTGVWKLQQHLREISLNGYISDVILKVKDQKFKSHKCILAARSPVFSAMVKSEMKESVTGVVDIPDINPEIFSDFLNYLYTGSAEIFTSENVAKLYTVADKYQVEALKENCLNYMLMNVSIENFCDILIISVQHNVENLKETCIQYFLKHSLNIIKSCKWQSLLYENPIICNELHIKFIELNKDNLKIAL